MARKRAMGAALSGLAELLAACAAGASVLDL